MLKSLLLHNNCFSQIPESMKNLLHLDELGLDWFQYMSLSNNTPKIAKKNGSLETIKDFIAYCEVFE